MTGAVVSLWVGLHLVQCVAAIGLGSRWEVPQGIDVAMGSVITLVLGGPSVLKALGRNGNGNGHNGNGLKA